MTEAQLITHTQAYEISTKVGAEVDSKGNVKPYARVQITRRLESSDEITELIHADMGRGVEETVEAIEQVHRRSSQ